MKRFKTKYTFRVSFIALFFMIIGCGKDFTDPTRVPEDAVFGTLQGLTGAVVGLQRDYTAQRTSSLYNSVTSNGFTTKELFLVNPGNLPEAQLNTGGIAVDGTNTILSGMWSNSNKIIYDANKVIEGAQLQSDKNYASGLIAYATIFKALALGNMSQSWEQVPNGIGVNVGFMARKDGFSAAITAIDQALAAINANPISTTFMANIPPGIDIVNTLNALKARYAMASGNNDLALAAANAVDLTKKSTFNFDATTQNPIFETATSSNNVYQPVDSTLGLKVPLQPDLTDKRVPFYTSINPTIAPRFRIKGFGETLNTPFPVYLPGEITLIKAEAYARKNDLTNGLIELNKILTKTAATDPFGLGANLPALASVATQQELLDQIYKNRCIELYMSGLKLEDMRRFNRPNSERGRNFYPYPLVERDNNTNTPDDPGF
ncbi:RagB/SusD family nutrient uptake outer membrane protein [Solitalea sp. MAHUQ-68]|uniref:RagB/SusD family nutrient uptake outer membrane protein n=1 Tax=Solitalea agri TaxID=2953739 RepID=A0A9X2JE64_9SPHI|nr:RagB/SusD family nutrient uptake outer membrane protein [Solitalea agri]MCO4293620.1 RagB/SusD family nutrient uptake outer membrane protein [Solitalea agri]